MVYFLVTLLNIFFILLYIETLFCIRLFNWIEIMDFEYHGIYNMTTPMSLTFIFFLIKRTMVISSSTTIATLRFSREENEKLESNKTKNRIILSWIINVPVVVVLYFVITAYFRYRNDKLRLKCKNYIFLIMKLNR